MKEHFSLRGRTALVTGAGRGIGAAVAKELATLGCHLILAGRTAERLQAVEAEIKADDNQASSSSIDTLPVDICEKEWLTALCDQDDAIDIFIHCAATFADYGPLEERTDEEIRAVIETNLTAALRISGALLPQMKKNNYGILLFIGSRAASLGAANQVLYATAKGGLEALVRSLTAENARFGIAAHLLELGLIDTERTHESMTDSTRRRMAAGTPAGRIGTPEDVAAAVRYLVSPDAIYLRGITLRIDGGMGLGLAPTNEPR